MERQGGDPRTWHPSESQLALLGRRCGAKQEQGGTPIRSLPGGNVPHPCDILPGLQGSWDQVHGTGRIPCPLEELHFLGTTLPSRPLTQGKAECPGKNQGPGSGTECRPRSMPGGAGSAGETHAHRRFSRGESGLRSTWVAESLALAETPGPCPEAADLDQAASTL